jgi:hypothetical protein
MGRGYGVGEEDRMRRSEIRVGGSERG